MEHRELYPELCGDLYGEEIQKRGDTCVCTADPPCSMVETDTTLKSNYTPIKINFKKLKIKHFKKAECNSSHDDIY